MEFEKQKWYNKNDTANLSRRIPISAASLNRFEDGIKFAVDNTNNMINHWWKRLTIQDGQISYPFNATTYGYYIWDNQTTEAKIYYSDSVTIKLDETTGNAYASLDSPTERTITYQTLYNGGSISISGKYCIYGDTTTKSGASLYYGGTVGYTWSSKTPHYYGFEFRGSLQAMITPVYGEVTFVSSDNKDEYPNGWSERDIAWYEYLGIPFENSRESWKMLTGWYYGDGTEERLIETGCKPKLVMLYNQLGDEYYEIDYAPYCYGMATEDFAFGGVQLADNGFLVGTNMSPSTNYKPEKFGYVVFY